MASFSERIWHWSQIKQETRREKSIQEDLHKLAKGGNDNAHHVQHNRTRLLRSQQEKKRHGDCLKTAEDQVIRIVAQIMETQSAQQQKYLPDEDLEAKVEQRLEPFKQFFVDRLEQEVARSTLSLQTKMLERDDNFKKQLRDSREQLLAERRRGDEIAKKVKSLGSNMSARVKELNAALDTSQRQLIAEKQRADEMQEQLQHLEQKLSELSCKQASEAEATVSDLTKMNTSLEDAKKSVQKIEDVIDSETPEQKLMRLDMRQCKSNREIAFLYDKLCDFLNVKDAQMAGVSAVPDGLTTDMLAKPAGEELEAALQRFHDTISDDAAVKFGAGTKAPRKGGIILGLKTRAWLRGLQGILIEISADVEEQPTDDKPRFEDAQADFQTLKETMEKQASQCDAMREEIESLKMSAASRYSPPPVVDDDERMTKMQASLAEYVDGLVRSKLSQAVSSVEELVNMEKGAREEVATRAEKACSAVEMLEKKLEPIARVCGPVDELAETLERINKATGAASVGESDDGSPRSQPSLMTAAFDALEQVGSVHAQHAKQLGLQLRVVNHWQANFNAQPLCQDMVDYIHTTLPRGGQEQFAGLNMRVMALEDYVRQGREGSAKRLRVGPAEDRN